MVIIETYLSNIQKGYDQSGRALLKFHQPATNGDILQDFDLKNPYQKWSLLSQSTKDGVTTFNLIQDLGNLHKPDENLVQFIKTNDKQNNYSWTDGWVQSYKPTIVDTHTPKKIQAPIYPECAKHANNSMIMNPDNLGFVPCAIHGTAGCKKRDQDGQKTAT